MSKRQATRRVFDYQPREYWEARGETYRSHEQALNRSGKTARQLEVIRRALGRIKPRIVLEIGCGSGRISRVLAHASETYIAVDIAKSMLMQARANVSGDEAWWLLADSANLPFRAKSVDTIVLSEVLLHIPPVGIEGSLLEIARVARRAIILDFFVKDFENPRRFRQVTKSLDSHNFLHDYPALFEATGLSIVSRVELSELSQTCFVLQSLRPGVFATHEGLQ